MARAPRPGEVNTRLEPLLGAQDCARLQAELIRHTAGWVTGCTRTAWLAFTPDEASADMAPLIPPGIRLFAQRGSDLGARLRRATELVFGQCGGPLAVIGADAPELGPVHVRCALRALGDGHDVSLTPSLDGGYALIALASPIPAAFDLPRDAWGGPRVLELTLRALQDAGCSCAMLEPVRDLDTPQDARYVAADPRCPPAVSQILRGASAA